MAISIFEKGDVDVQAQKAAESALRTKRRDRDNLAERLGISEVAVVSHRAKARELARDGGDDAAITKAEGKMRDAQDRVVTLSGAIGDVDKIIAGLEAQVEAIIDRRCRVATGEAVSAMASELEDAGREFASAARRLADAAGASGLLVPEGTALHQWYAPHVRDQLAPTVEIIVGALQGHARGVLEGRYPPSLPRPAPEPVKLALVKPITTQNIFALRNLKYKNAQGGVTCIGKNKRHDVPEALAALAIASKVALPISERKLIAELEQNAIPYLPDESACSWLGEKGPEAPVRSARPVGPILSSTFTPMDRGGPYPAAFVRPAEPEPQPLAAAGARNAPNVDEG
jgi:hypothetical protein